VPDAAPVLDDEVAALRAANARLHEEIEAKDTEIAALRTSYQAQLDALLAQVAALSAEVADLRARLGQNSRNSSKPPSSEGLAKPAPRSLRRRTGRKPGRPKGQPGATLEMTNHPDKVVTHEPGRCAGCRNGLFGVPVTRTERRQKADRRCVPPNDIYVARHASGSAPSTRSRQSPAHVILAVARAFQQFRPPADQHDCGAPAASLSAVTSVVAQPSGQLD
jgi:hypothetical protein